MRPRGGMKVTLKHGEIEDLMPAMTMEFPVASAEILRRLLPGDKITYTLHPQRDSYFIEKREKEK